MINVARLRVLYREITLLFAKFVTIAPAIG
jgi:hypothetical protein